MGNALILFSHKLTDGQIKDLEGRGVGEIVFLPEGLKKKWSDVPPELETLKDFADDFIRWIKENADGGDYVIVQGDYGITNIIVDFCFKNNLIPVYSTTERIHREVKLPDGSVKMEKLFKHKIFRRYERWEE